MTDSLAILLIDDDAVARGMVRKALISSGVAGECTEATTGEAGLEAMVAAPFDCVLLDHSLGDMNGLAVLQAARAAGVKTPIILLTREGDEALAVELVRAGASDHLNITRLSRDLLSHSIRHAVRLHRAQAEALLARDLTAESEQRFRTMADSAPVLLWVSDEQGKAIYFNVGWLRFTGRTLEQQLGDGWLASVHPDDLQRTRDAFNIALASRAPLDIELRLRQRDDEYRWVLNNGAPRFLPDGTFAGFVGSCIDITERKRAEEDRNDLLAREQSSRASAEASEQRYRFLAESIPQQVWTSWPDGRLDYVASNGVAYFGIPADELLADGWHQVIHPDDLSAAQQRWMNALRTGEEYEIEFRLRRADGAYRWHLARALPQRDADGTIIKWFGTNTDIDEQKRSQESVRFLAEASVCLASSLDYSTTLAAVAKLAVPQIADWCAVDMLAADGSITRLTVEHADSAKMALADELHQRYPVQPNDRAGVPRVIRTAESELFSLITDEAIDELAKDPEHAQILRSLGLASRITVPLLSRGRALGAMTFVTAESGRRYDADDLAFAEDLARRAATAVDNALLYEALRASEEQYRVLAEVIPQLVWSTRGDGWCDYLSIQWVRFTGVPEFKHLGHAWLDAVHPDDRERTLTAWQNAIAGTGDYDVEYRLRRADGAYRWFKTRGVPLRDEQGRPMKWFGTSTDIHDRKRFEQELKDAKESAEAANNAKDQFLAVLSHELRTPLTPVLSTVQAIESEPSLPADLRPSIDMIKRNVELEARLIDDLLDLTRISRGKIEFNTQVVDAHRSMLDAIDICRDEIGGKAISVHMDLIAGRHHVRADSARLQQVFWNLIKNAVKFTPANGEIWIRTANNKPEGISNGKSNEAQSHLTVEVQDSGIGIEKELLPRIFDAFEQGERSITRRFGGLGLGLAISKALIEMQGGTLFAHSEGKGQGAQFIVELSTVDEPVQKPSDSGPSAMSRARKSLRILLVDDHEDTARAMGRLLQRLGHKITTAHTVNEALESMNRDGADLLISDIGLPDGSGLELMRQIREQYDVQGIALSGFGMEEDVKKSKDAGFFDHLIKPINFQKLEAVIRRATSENK